MKTPIGSPRFAGGTAHVLLACPNSGTSQPVEPTAAARWGREQRGSPAVAHCVPGTHSLPPTSAGPGREARGTGKGWPGTGGRSPGSARRGGSDKAGPPLLRADTGVRGRSPGGQPPLPSSLYSPGSWRGVSGCEAARTDESPLARTATLKLPLPCGSGCSRTKAARQPIPAARRRPGRQSPPAARPGPAPPGLSQPRRRPASTSSPSGAASCPRVRTPAIRGFPRHEKRGNLGL